jgi:hypothetical protein
VQLYDSMPYGGAYSEVASASLLLPTSTWGANYVAVTPLHPDGLNTPNTLAPAFTLIAAEDGTDVTILPSVAIAGSADADVAPSEAGVPVTYSLARGQVLTLRQDDDLLGSIVQSTKPIGMWAEQECMDLGSYACDGAHQQIPPIAALGSEYVAVRYRNRVDNTEETPPVRVVGAVDGTTLTYDPAAPPGAPTTLNAGQMAMFSPAGPVVVRSQDAAHPFYMNAYMTGGYAYNYRGDPEFVNIVPAAQYMTRYVFYTDPTYPETNLVYVRKKGDDGAFHDVTLDCSGVLAGWTPIGTSGTYEFVRVDLSTGNFQAQGNCNNGTHETHSDAPFGLTVWGWVTYAVPNADPFTSYAYPAGASLRPINTVVVAPVPR